MEVTIPEEVVPKLDEGVRDEEEVLGKGGPLLVKIELVELCDRLDDA